MSNKQKLNTKSSTKADLIGADDALPQMLWTKYFTRAQGYGIEEKRIYQDNMSAMLLETNRDKSSTKKRNIYGCAIFVDIKQCPMTKMLADQVTKPLQ